MNKGIHTRVSPIAFETGYLEDARGARAFTQGEIRRRKGMALSNVSALGARLNGLASFFAFGGIPWVSYFDSSGNLFVFESPAVVPPAGDILVDCTVAQTSTHTITGATNSTAANQNYTFESFSDNDPQYTWQWQGVTESDWKLRLFYNGSNYTWTLTEGVVDNWTGTPVNLGCVKATGKLTWEETTLTADAVADPTETDVTLSAETA